MCLMSAEYEDLNGGCPTPANSSVRPAYIYPNNPTINDPWSFYKRTLTFQASHLLCISLFSPVLPWLQYQSLASCNMLSDQKSSSHSLS